MTRSAGHATIPPCCVRSTSAIADRRIRTSTLDARGESCSLGQVLDIVATVTMYHAMAIVTRTFTIPIDEEKPSFSIKNVE